MGFTSFSKVSLKSLFYGSTTIEADAGDTGWANTTNFPPKDNNFVSGFDPIIGQAPNEGPRTVTGADPKKPNDQLPLPVQWVLSRGGEYFFSPSIPALKQNLALAA